MKSLGSLSMIIYRITNRVNGKRYYGQTTYSLEKRWREHLSKLSTNHPLYTSMRKYGVENFDIEQVAMAASQEDLDLLEQQYIFKSRTYLRAFGYNLDLGGRGRGKHSEATRQKISEGLTGKTLPQETRDRISRSNTGKHDGPREPRSQETKDKISAKLSGRILSPEHKANISSSMRG